MNSSSRYIPLIFAYILAMVHQTNGDAASSMYPIDQSRRLGSNFLPPTGLPRKPVMISITWLWSVLVSPTEHGKLRACPWRVSEVGQGGLTGRP